MLAIDTLKLAEDLKKGGFDDKQTESLVNLGRELSRQALEKIATKDDLKALEERMDGKLDGLRTEMKADWTVSIANLKTEMYKAMAAQTIVLLGIGFTLFKLFG